MQKRGQWRPLRAPAAVAMHRRRGATPAAVERRTRGRRGGVRGVDARRHALGALASGGGC